MWKLFKQISIIAKVAETGIPSKEVETFGESGRKVERERWLNRNFVLGSSRSCVYYNTTLEFHPGNKFLDVSSLDSSAPLIVLPPSVNNLAPYPTEWIVYRPVWLQIW